VSAAYLLCLDDESFLSDQERVLIERFRAADPQRKDRILRSAKVETASPLEGPAEA
jgi:hypothetical protein